MLHRICIVFLSCSVTLYAEFLPSKQRAKCVVLLDVSVLFVFRCWPLSEMLIFISFFFFFYVKSVLLFCFGLVFLGIRCMFRSFTSLNYYANFRLAMAVSYFYYSVVSICLHMSGMIICFL